MYGVDLDTAAPDIEEPSRAHRALAAENDYVVVSMANLERVPFTGAFAVVALMMLTRAGGAAARVFVFREQTTHPVMSLCEPRRFMHSEVIRNNTKFAKKNTSRG